MIAGFAPLFADGTDILKIIGFIIVALIYVFNHFVGNKAQQRKPQRPEMRPRPPGAPAGRQEVNDEVAEFLRRTAERSSAKKRVEEEPQQPVRRPLTERRLSSLPSSGEVVEVEAVDEPPTGAGVAAHVQRHLDPRAFGERASQLTHTEQEARLFQSHVQQTFDHQVGHLAQRSADIGGSGQEPVEPPSAAASIAALLAEPQSLRGAVVLNEILQRPSDRW